MPFQDSEILDKTIGRSTHACCGRMVMHRAECRLYFIGCSFEVGGNLTFIPTCLAVGDLKDRSLRRFQILHALRALKNFSKAIN